MKRQELFYKLPKELIAQYPSDKRETSKLLVILKEEKEFIHTTFDKIIDFLKEGDLLVLNSTKVYPARLKIDKFEFLICEKILEEENLFKALCKPYKKINPNLRFKKDGVVFYVKEKKEGFVILEFPKQIDVFSFLEEVGEVPLPPYIKRKTQDIDKQRYQTVYAKQIGSVAAPTAGLHFTQELLEKIQQKGAKVKELILHIGIGTFKPIKIEDLNQHHMDEEYYCIGKDLAKEIEAGGRVIAVGTSSVRALESFASTKRLEGKTSLFIYPPYQYKVARGLVTNFHAPYSTPLALVCAFATKDIIMQAYKQAIERGYSFLSYGDAMFII